MATDLSTLMTNQQNPVKLWLGSIYCSDYIAVGNMDLPNQIVLQDGSNTVQALMVGISQYVEGTYILNYYQRPWMSAIGNGTTNVTASGSGAVNFGSSPQINGQDFISFDGETATFSSKIDGWHKINYSVLKTYSNSLVEQSFTLYLVVNGVNQGTITGTANAGNPVTSAGTYSVSGCFTVLLNQSPSNTVQLCYASTLSAGGFTLTGANISIECIAPKTS